MDRQRAQDGPTVFSSLFATIATLSGVAIGLGNVWRFPYMMGSYGGSAFLLVFLALVVLIGIPAMAAELGLARTYRGATITSLAKAFGRPGRILGWLLVLSVTIAASYYFMVVGNVFFSMAYSVLVGFDAASTDRFAALLTNPYIQYPVALAIAWSALWVVDRGLNAGIERVSNLFIPVFFLIALYLIVTALRQPGATDALAGFMEPDFGRIGFQEAFAALGQVFFSMGLGATYILVYGKYLRPETNIRGAAALTALNDTAASVLASLFIVPTVLVFGLPLDSGPHLIFNTLPELFARMAGGRVFGSLMLIGLFLVAFLSVIASFQVITVSVSEQPLGRRISPRRVRLIAALIVSVLMPLPAWYPAIIGPMDLVLGSAMMITGCFFAVLAFGWHLRREDWAREIGWAGDASVGWSLVAVWIRWVIPAVLFLIMAGTVYDVLQPG